MADTIVSVFDALPPQRAFLTSPAKIRGYGGAMGGGKSRTGCEQVFDYALDNPGLFALVARQAHTSIVETTKKTMVNQVIDPRLITRSRASAGEDYVQLWNGSTIHFVGLDDPIRWYSSEIGVAFFDECQEIEEDTVLRIVTRLRQRCRICEQQNIRDCAHMPNKAILTFNPSNPGHWLQKWFMLDGAEKTEHGFYKPELWMEGAIESIGDSEFVFARAADNPFLPTDYLKHTLGGMKEWMRRRYLEGLWEFISGNAFFDPDSLRYYIERAASVKPVFASCHTVGDIDADVAYRTGRSQEKPKDKQRITIEGESGPLIVFKKPVRRRLDEKTQKFVEAHRYVISIDASSGRGTDFSAIQVLDVETFEQVAEWQGKLETGLVAQEAYRLGRIYNDAYIVPEVTGGWGLAVEQVLKRYHYKRLYLKRTFDRLSQKFTDKTGFDTTIRMRYWILEVLETAVRERELGLYSMRTLGEMGTFVYSEREKPEAQPGHNDDLVLSLAIGVKVVTDLPRNLRKTKEPVYVPQFEVTGY